MAQKQKLIIGVVALVALVGGFFAYTSMQHGELVEGIKRKTNLIVGLEEMPETLNPLTTRSEAGLQIAETLFDGLHNSSGQDSESFEPALIYDIQQDANRKNIYTLELKTDVAWQDSPDHLFTAKDVVHTIDTIMVASNDSPIRGRLSRQIQKVEVINDANIRIIFKEALSLDAAPAVLSFKIIPATYFGKEMGKDLKNDPVAQEFARKPIGTGPFKLAKWEGNEIVLEAAKAEAINFDAVTEADLTKDEAIRSITFTLIQDTAKQAKMLMDGKIDLILKSEADLHEKLSGAGLSAADYVSHHFYGLAINTTKAPFNSAATRRGLAQAINKTAAASMVWSDGPEKFINVGPFPHNADRAYKSLHEQNPYNAQAAKRALASAAGKPITLIYSEKEANTMEKVAGRIAQDLTDAGLTVEVKALGMAFDTQLQNKNYDIALVKHEGFTKGYDISPLFNSKGSKNYTGFGSAGFDSLLTDWVNSGFWEQKLPLGMKIHTQLSSESPYVFLFTLPTRAYYSARVKEMSMNDPSALLATVETWKISNK